jgi:SAM-dependent methyltransferase
MARTNLKPNAARLVPGVSAVRTELEHRRRYRFFAHLAKGEVIADIACGFGYGTRQLAKQGQWAVGIDRHQETLVTASHHCSAPKLIYLCADAQKLPLVSGSIDRIFSFLTIEYLTDADSFLSEVRRILRPGGLFILATPNRLTHSPGQAKPRDPLHVQEWTLSELRELLERHFHWVLLLGQRRRLPCAIRTPPAEQDHFLLAVCAPDVPSSIVQRRIAHPPPARFWLDQYDLLRLVWRWLIWKTAGQKQEAS